MTDGRTDTTAQGSDRLLAFYADDFTGATDAMDALSRAGVETVLFLSPPSEADLDRLAAGRAVGVAGTTRSMAPDAIEAELEPAFGALDAADAPLVHYKVCSTFDSSPEVGSIGAAVDVGADVFDASTVPLVPGAPPLGRYVVFGTMFAEYDGEVYRLDRHPTMSDHPVTPMEEADLRRHLAEQTDRSLGLVDVRGLREGPDEAVASAAPDAEVLFFDAVDRDDLGTVGRLVWEGHAATPGTGFVVGSSGVEYALAAHWHEAGLVDADTDFDPLEPVDRTVVMSGSASPATERQIERALADGFEGVRIDTEALVRPAEAARERERVVEAVTDVLERGESVVAYAALGPDDPAIERTRAAAERVADAPATVGTRVARQQGEILRAVTEATDLRRLCVAGGDTCGHVVPALGIDALTVRYPLMPGTPVCEVVGDGRAADLQVALKGGQLGGPDYLVALRRGTE